MVELMLGAAAAVGQAGIQGEGEPAPASVGLWAGGAQHPMHGVVGDDEQAGVQKAAQQHAHQHQQGFDPRPCGHAGGQGEDLAEPIEIDTQQAHPTHQPGKEDGRRPAHAPDAAGAQRASLSSSAGEASRSMATK